MTDLLALAVQATLYRSVAQFDCDGRIFWAKRRPASKETIWHRLQGMAANLFKWPLLNPTASTGGGHSLRHEAARYRDFAARGIAVPAVAAVDDTVLVLGDCGQQLKQLVDYEPEPAQRYILLQQTIVALAQLHQAGLAHGRPLLRDMTMQDGIIHFIDLEDDPAAVMPIAQAQARDIWLFLNGIARYTRHDATQLRDLFILYTQRAPQTVLPELRRLVRFLQPLRVIAQSIVMPFAGQDVWQAVYANAMLERYLLSPRS